MWTSKLHCCLFRHCLIPENKDRIIMIMKAAQTILTAILLAMHSIGRIKAECLPGEFETSDGSCVADQSQELPSGCLPGEYECDDGSCILYQLLCNDDARCADTSQEEDNFEELCLTVENCKCAVDPEKREVCPNLPLPNQATCEAAGCCWDAKRGGAFCFIARTDVEATKRQPACPVLSRDERVECGWKHITPEQCACIGCCFHRMWQTYWCYQSPSA